GASAGLGAKLESKPNDGEGSVGGGGDDGPEESSKLKAWLNAVLDMIPNGVYRAELEVETIINKMRERMLRWVLGRVKRRPQSAPVRRVEVVVVDGSRRRGRPKLRWEDRLKHDMKEKATVSTS
ncbi:hypothetical protein Tco_0184130, partial [Tanacetum coccineum]